MSDNALLRHPDPILHCYLLLDERVSVWEKQTKVLDDLARAFSLHDPARHVLTQLRDEEEQARKTARKALVEQVCEALGIAKIESDRLLERLLIAYELKYLSTRPNDSLMWTGPTPWRG